MSDQQHDEGAKPRIIIIDDSRLVRVSIANVLQDDFDIREAGDGEEGWESLLADDQIQVVLTDAGMPNLDGYGLIERIRAHSDARLRDIPIIMITAAEDEESRQRALGIGATDFITKPFDKAQLLARTRAQARLDQTSRDLAEHATDDQLTGVRSRRYFLKRGEQDLAFAMRHQRDLALIVVAIDPFNAIKQGHGNEVANELLCHVAKTLKMRIRTEDTLARIHDSQFAVLAPTLGQAEAIAVCDRILQKIANTPFARDDVELSLTVSLGLVIHGIDQGQSIDDYLSLATKYAAEAQAQGGNRFVKLTAAGKEELKKRISLDAVERVLETGNPERLLPHLDKIAEQILPLLAFCNEQKQWGLEEQLKTIEEKISRSR